MLQTRVASCRASLRARLCACSCGSSALCTRIPPMTCASNGAEGTASCDMWRRREMLPYPVSCRLTHKQLYQRAPSSPVSHEKYHYVSNMILVMPRLPEGQLVVGSSKHTSCRGGPHSSLGQLGVFRASLTDAPM